MSIPPGDEPGQAGWINSKRFLQEEGATRSCDGCGEPPRHSSSSSNKTSAAGGDEGDVALIPLKRCARCHHAWYHDRACQIADHGRHKGDCRRWAATIKNEPRLESYPFIEAHQAESPAVDVELYERTRSVWDRGAATWDDRRPVLGNGVFYREFFLPACFDGDREKRVDVIVDFGCATGTLTGYMRRHVRDKVVAFDLAPNMIDQVNANAWPDVETVAGCINDMDDPAVRAFRDAYRGKVDLIVWSTVLPYVPHRQKKATFLAFRDLLKAGGKVCHVDLDKRSTGATFPNYVTTEECETYYKWGRLEQLRCEVALLDIKNIYTGATVMKQSAVLGVAVKKEGEEEEEEEGQASHCASPIIS